MGICQKCCKEVPYESMNMYDVCFECSIEANKSAVQGGSKIGKRSKLSESSDGVKLSSLENRYQSKYPQE